MLLQIKCCETFTFSSRELFQLAPSDCNSSLCIFRYLVQQLQVLLLSSTRIWDVQLPVSLPARVSETKYFSHQFIHIWLYNSYSQSVPAVYQPCYFTLGINTYLCWDTIWTNHGYLGYSLNSFRLSSAKRASKCFGNCWNLPHRLDDVQHLVNVDNGAIGQVWHG